jgi:hypothetical protein
MPLPSTLTFNELNGEEVRAVLENRFEQIMSKVPYFQRHLTFPRVKMTLNVKLEVWADQPQPEAVKLTDALTIAIDIEPEPDTFEAESVDSTAPVAGGHPPDQVREMHHLPISQPAPGPREVGGHIATSDRYPETSPLDGREVQLMPGLTVSRTGSGVMGGMATSANATVAKIDQGPAGLRLGKMNRDQWHFGGPK